MTSKRKIAKLRKMEVSKVIKKIKQYRLPFDYKYGGGYFIFSFDANEFNLHITFRQLPMMKFGIWKTKSYGDKNWYFFAECFPYINKFKPSYCKLKWDSLESMMEWVSKCIKEPRFYISELESKYCGESEYFPHNFQDILKDYADNKYEDSHNGFSPEEYETHLKAFNQIISKLDTKDYDIFWRKADGFKNLYCVHYYASEWITEEQMEELENQLRNCKCFSFGGNCLPPYFFKHKNQYRWKIHPGNRNLYFNQKKHFKYFNHSDKS